MSKAHEAHAVGWSLHKEYILSIYIYIDPYLHIFNMEAVWWEYDMRVELTVDVEQHYGNELGPQVVADKQNKTPLINPNNPL